MLHVEERLRVDSTQDIATQNAGAGFSWRGKAFACFVVLYAGMLAWFCSVKVMAFDEMLSFYTARVPSVAALLSLQRNHPVSLDPPLIHLAAHWSLGLGLNPVFCVRLPSLIGALLLMGCVYLFVQRLAGNEIASFSLVGLLLTDQFHLVEARPYGALLGLSALALVLWQNAVREQGRSVSLAGLFLTLGIATGSHYFGILLMTPFLVAECLRVVQRRKLDVAMLAALSGSLLFALIWLPYLQGAHQYKSKYYIKVKAVDLAWAYTSLLQSALNLHASLAGWILCIVVLLAVVAGAYLGYRKSRQMFRSASFLDRQAAAVEWTAVAAFALLPIAGVALASVASGAFESRYVVEFTLGMVICFSAGIVSVIPRPRLRVLLLVAGCGLALAGLAFKARQDVAQRAALEQLARTLAPRTLITDKEEFLWLHTYAGTQPGPAQALWVADLNRQIAWSGSDNIDRTMLNLKVDAGLPVIAYEQVVQAPAEMQIIVNGRTEPVNWLPHALTASGMRLKLIETNGQDRVYRVTPAFPQK